MKRSEAIKHIALYLDLPSIRTEPSNFNLKIAERALDCVERLGMSPPICDKPKQMFNGGYAEPKGRWEDE
jgi:hypothetical protein